MNSPPQTTKSGVRVFIIIVHRGTMGQPPGVEHTHTDCTGVQGCVVSKGVHVCTSKSNNPLSAITKFILVHRTSHMNIQGIRRLSLKSGIFS